MSQPLTLEDVARAAAEERALLFVRKVGEGAFKETFEVRSRDGTPYALKVFKPGSSAERTSRELKALLTCNHPHVAKLLSIDNVRVRRVEFLTAIEEFLAGGTLGQRSVSPIECRGVGGKLISAVAHIAGLRLVHRDIKPDNIMFRSGIGSPVLVDFGIVRNLADTSITPSWAPRGPGTPYFAPPEQLNNEKHLLDWRADQFSLGVALSVVTLKRHPYQRDSSDNDSDVVDRVAAREPLPSEFGKAARAIGLPALARMVSPWPVQRYRTPADLQRGWEIQTGVT